MGSIHAARIDHSPRQQRTLAALRANRAGLTTAEVIRAAGVCAVNSIMDELREQGFPISTSREVQDGARVWRYRLEEAA